MTFRPAADPAQAYERNFMNEQDAHARAKDYDEKGWPYMAKRARRQAAGHKAARTRIARTQGWIDGVSEARS